MPEGMKGVQIGPGSTPFTRMPFSDSNWARLNTMLLRAPLVAL
jgi:hypothetical protein